MKTTHTKSHQILALCILVLSALVSTPGWAFWVMPPGVTPLTSRVALAPAFMDVTTEIGICSSTTFTITNTGTLAQKLTQFNVGFSGFRITSNNCPEIPSMLASGAKCEVNVEICPTGAGSFISEFTFNANGRAMSAPLTAVVHGRMS